MVRVGLGRRLELGLGFGELAGIEQDHALVVRRLGIATTAYATAGVLRGVRARLGSEVELLLRVVEIGQRRVRIRVVRLQFDRLLERRLRFSLLLFRHLRYADVVVTVGARRDLGDHFLELGDRFVVTAGLHRFDRRTCTCLDRGRGFLVTRAHTRRGAQREGQWIVRALTDVGVQRLRADLVLRRCDLVSA